MKKTTLALALLFAATASAYEPNVVHRNMTKLAFDAARNKRDFLQIFDLQPSTKLRSRTAQDWCADGGRDEDAAFPPYPRSLSHFFDPVNEIPLSIGFCPKITMLGSVRADDWGLDASLNTFDLHRARQDYRDAIALPTPQQREEALAHLFYSLGHVMHLVEDMAQPEHTRNDQHLFPHSLYEEYTARLFDPNNPNAVNPSSFMTGYPVVDLPHSRDYFHGGTSNRGMADYSNGNFITQDTNFHDRVRRCPRFDYANPSLSGTYEQSDEVTELVRLGGPIFYFQEPRTFWIHSVYRPVVPDAYDATRAATDQLLTTRSFLDRETRIFHGVEVYSEDDATYRTKADLLIPRAVGYAAGLLDHFFRGRVDAEWSEIAPLLANLKITNRSSETLSNATVKIHGRIVGQTSDIVAPFVELNVPTLAPNDSVDLGVDLGNLGYTVKQFLKLERRLVINGRLGSEDDTVIGMIQAPERGKILAMRYWNFQLYNQPAELKRIRVGGVGPAEHVKTLAATEYIWRVFDPRSDRGWGDISPDGTRVVFQVPSNVNNPEFSVAEIASGALQHYPPPLPTIRNFQFVGFPAWSPDGTRIVFYSVVGPHQVTETATRRGLTTIDTASGSVVFHPFEQLTDQGGADFPGINWAEWSRDGRYVYSMACCGASVGGRFDFFTNQVEIMPATAGHWFVGTVVLSADGTKVYGAALSANPAEQTPALYELDWPTGVWTRLTEPVNLTGQPAMSPDGTEIAFTRHEAGGCEGYMIMTYNLVTHETKPATRDCSGATGTGPVWWNMVWLPD